jgi:hypothetical protein
MCDHIKVVLRRKYTDASYVDSWHCDDCEVEFFPKLHIDELCKQYLFPEPKTMRDEFATAALNAYISCDASGCSYWQDTKTTKGTAENAYIWADALLEARKK